MATYSFHRLIIGKVEIGNFYCLNRDNRILFLQKCLLNSSSHFFRLLSELLNLIGCLGNINSLFSKKICFSRTISRLKVHQVHVYGISDQFSCAFLLLCYIRHFDKTFTGILLDFHCCALVIPGQ